MAAERRAHSIKQQRAAYQPGRRCRRRAEEGGTLWRLCESTLCIGLARSGLRGGRLGSQLRTGPHRRYRVAPDVGSAKQYITHVVKKAARPGRDGIGPATLECFDAGIGGLERLVLN